MDKPIVASVWTPESVAELPDTSFLLFTESKLKLVPYKDKDGTFSETNFLHGIASVQKDQLSEQEQGAFLRKARRIASENKVDLSEYFLDDMNLAGPLFDEWAFHTAVEFNRGAFKNSYLAEELDLYGRKLAQVLTKRRSIGTSVRQYDEDGNPTLQQNKDTYVTDSEYIYHDGLVVRRKYTSKDSGRTETTYSNIPAGSGIQSSPNEVSDMAEEREGEEFVEILSEEIEILLETEPDTEFFTAESFVERATEGEDEVKTTTALTGLFVAESIKEQSGIISFDVPLFVLDDLTANNNRYTAECARNLTKDLAAILQGQGSKNYGERSAAGIMLRENFDGIAADMRVSHDSRFGKSNEILEIAGRVTGGYVSKIEGKATFILKGETLKTRAGQDVAALLGQRPPLLRGVSLFGLPTEYAENDQGGHDINRLHLLGADFTNEGANLRQFASANSAGFMNVVAA